MQKQNHNEVKKESIRELGLTARQFNSIIYDLKGRVRASAENEINHLNVLSGKVETVEEKIEKLKNRIKIEKEETRRKDIQFIIHQKNRRRGNLISQKTSVARKLSAKSSPPRLCFGSPKLFRAQHNLEANGYQTHEEWKADWQFARNSQFFLIGPKDESAGCQSCQYDVETHQLKLRLTNEQVERFGYKYLIFEEVKFGYGEEVIRQSLEKRQAISWRMVARKDECGQIQWYAKASTKESEIEISTDIRKGILGVDLNAGHISIGEVSGDGNPLGEQRIEIDVLNKMSNQTEAIIGDAVKQIVGQALKKGIPIAVEQLDFSAKKKRLDESGKKYARMLSSFVYALFFQMLMRSAQRHGVEVIAVDPSYGDSNRQNAAIG